MDKKAKRWSWLPTEMPGVARLVAEKRRLYGDAHVNECWARAMAGEPGHFFAREGPLAIGTPWDEPEMANFAAQSITSTQAVLVMRKPEVPRGAQ